MRKKKRKKLNNGLLEDFIRNQSFKFLIIPLEKIYFTNSKDSWFQNHVSPQKTLRERIQKCEILILKKKK